MRYLFFLLLLFVLAVAGVVASQLYLNDTILIQYGSAVVKPPLWLALSIALLGGIALLIALRVLLWVLFFPTMISRWNRHRRNEKQARLRENTLRQAVYGNRRGQLKALAELSAIDAAAAWRAAQVAEELADVRAQAKHLQQAANGKDAVVAAAAKAKLCLQDNRLTEADNILRTAGAPNAAPLLAQMYYEVAKKRGEEDKALAAALQLREESPAQFGKWVEETIQRQFHKVGNAAAATSFWRDSVSSGDRKRPDLLVHYLRALWRLGDEKAATDALGQAMRNHPQSNEVLQVVAEFGTPAQCETAFKANEKRADKASASDVQLLELLTALANKLNLPGKARLYTQMLTALQAQVD